MSPTASIIVCTRNRSRSLARTIASIVDDNSRVSRELVVVDNGSTDDTREVVQRAAACAHIAVVYRYEARAGQCHARNAGITAARAEFVLFTDDDVIVRGGWADALMRAFEDPKVAAAGGRVVPTFVAPPPEWMRGPHLRTSALADYGPTERNPSSDGDDLPFGANLALRRSVLDPATPFDPALGHTGTVSMGWDEWHLLKTLERNHRIAYVPGAVVEHHLDPSRQDWDAVRRAHFQNGFGLSRHMRLSGEPLPSLPRRCVRALRVLRDARCIERRNAHLPQPSPDEAWEEFKAYQWAGKQVESVFARAPRIAAWVAQHIA